MNLPFVLLIQMAGVTQLVIALANFFAPAKLGYRENLGKVSPIIRQIFLVHAAYIVFVLVALGLISLLYPQDLCRPAGLGKFLCGFMAFFWSLRVGLQFFYYDLAIKRQNPWGTFCFGFAFLYLAGVFTAATFLAK